VKSSPQFQLALNTKRFIVGPRFDESGDENESEYSFVHPYVHKRCNVKFRTLLERLSANMKYVQHFGDAIRLHMERKIEQWIEDDNESNSSKEQISKSNTIDLILDKTAGCAATLRTVAEDVSDINPCGTTKLTTPEGEVYDDKKQWRVRPIKIVCRKKASEAEIWMGELKDDLTVTSDEFYNDDDSFSEENEESWSFSSRSSYQSDQCNHCLHRLEMHPKSMKLNTKLSIDPKILNSNDKNEDKISLSTSKSTDSNVNHLENDMPVALEYFRWESREASIFLSSIPACSFLTSSPVGPVITTLTCRSLTDVLQLGDVIIRLNDIDVSSLEMEFVLELLLKFEAEYVRVTYLRKTMHV